MNLLEFGLKNIGTIQSLINGYGMMKQFFNPQQNNGFFNNDNPYHFNNPYYPYFQGYQGYQGYQNPYFNPYHRPNVHFGNLFNYDRRNHRNNRPRNGFNFDSLLNLGNIARQFL